MESSLIRIKSLYAEAIHNGGDSSGVLYDRIFNIIRTAIQNEDIPAGTSLPSTRMLAKELNISRSTVVQVFELLKIGRLIESKAGSGYKVSHHFTKLDRRAPLPEDRKKDYPPLSNSGKAFLQAISSLENARDEETAFRPGLPPLDIFPVNQWKILNNLYWRHVKDAELSYVASSGSNQLRASMANYLNFTRKIKCDPRQIIIVSGSLQSIYAIGNIILNPGDTIAHENPTFPNVISIFQGLQANVQTIPIDDQGLEVSKLSKSGEPNAKIVHTVPSCHYPTGIRMSVERRKELIQWASRNNSIIIENDYEHEVNNYHDFLPSIYSLDTEQRTFFLGTFNRLLHPSIRIGYMVVPHHYLDAMESLLRHLHRFVPNSKQMVLSQFIEKNYLYKHIQHLIEIAEERKEYFCNAFDSSFAGAIQIQDCGTRSLHVLAELPEYLPDQKLIQQFRDHHIAVHSYSKTFVGCDAKQGLILGYTPVKRTEMKQKIKKMHKIYSTFKRNRL